MQQPGGLGAGGTVLCSPHPAAGRGLQAVAACAPLPSRTRATATHTYRVMVDSSDILQECC